MKSWLISFLKGMSVQKPGVRDYMVLLLFICCFSFAAGQAGRYDKELSGKVRLHSPWMAKEDEAGSLYVVDEEKARIIKVENGQVSAIMNAGDSRGAAFECANSICVSEKGILYILDSGWSQDGLSVESESILRYEPRQGSVPGVDMGTLCYRVEYERGSCDKPRLSALESDGEFLFFVSADDMGFELNCLDPETMKKQIMYRIEMREALTLIQDFAIDLDKRAVYAVDKRGKLLYADASSKTARTLYDEAVMENGKTVFYHAALGQDGSVYVTDIASDRLLRYDRTESGMNGTEVLKGEKIWNVSCRNNGAGGVRLCFVSGDRVGVSDGRGKTVFIAQAFPKAPSFYMGELVFDAAAAAAAFAAAWIILRILCAMLTLELGRTKKMGALLTATVLAVSSVLAGSLLAQFRTVYQDELLNKLSMTAQIIGGKIQEPDLETLEKPENFMGKSYMRLWDCMNQVLDRKRDYGKDIYCNLLRYDGEKGYAVAYLDNSIGTYYPLTAEETAEVSEVYRTGEQLLGEIKQETGSYLYVMTPVKNPEGEVCGIVTVGTLSSVIEGKINVMLKNIVIAVLMLLLAVLFLFSEAISYFELKEKSRTLPGHNPPMHLIRVSIFITFCAFNMGTSFLPVYILRFSGPQNGILHAVAGSLPLTLNLICVGVTSLLCPGLTARFGFGPLAFFGGMLALCGDLIMAFCPNYAFAAVGLMLNGAGVGLATNSLHILIASLSARGEVENGFSLFNAASLSGVNCGMLLGSALAQRLGQNRVFFVSAGIWVITALLFLSFGKMMRPEQPVWAEAGGGGTSASRSSGFCRFLFSGPILKFLICIQAPYMILNSFVYYYVPIYGAEQGFPENVTSLLIITCSLLSVYLSVGMTGWAGRKLGEKSIYLAGAVTFAGLSWFAFRMTPFALFLALCCMGVSGSFGPAVRVSRFLGLKESEEYGEARAMGCYDFVDNLGESGGSMIFAWIISVGFRVGITALIGCIIVLNAVYGLSGSLKKEKKR